jgi:hypothetical protein
MLTVLTPEAVEARWPVLEKLLGRSVMYSNDEFNVEDLRELVAAREAIVLGMFRDDDLVLAAVAEIARYPRKTVLYVIALGGRELNVAVRCFWDGVEEVASMLGATAVQFAVRPVMERYMGSLLPEAKQVYAVLEKKLWAAEAAETVTTQI